MISVYLASASPRRHELLLNMGVAHTVLDIPSPPGEDEPRLPNELAVDYVLRTAREKAQRAMAWVVQQGLHPQPILSADTTVVLGETILGKPADANDAAAMLARLAGRSHRVRTAVVLAANGQLTHAVSETRVEFRALTTSDIERYCASGEPLGKAGAYGVQGLAGAFVKNLHGSYSGVVGLPIVETARLLRRCGITVP
jgi:septum formation protein